MSIGPDVYLSSEVLSFSFSEVFFPFAYYSLQKSLARDLNGLNLPA